MTPPPPFWNFAQKIRFGGVDVDVILSFVAHNLFLHFLTGTPGCRTMLWCFYSDYSYLIEVINTLNSWSNLLLGTPQGSEGKLLGDFHTTWLLRKQRKTFTTSWV